MIKIGFYVYIVGIVVGKYWFIDDFGMFCFFIFEFGSGIVICYLLFMGVYFIVSFLVCICV